MLFLEVHFGGICDTTKHPAYPHKAMTGISGTLAYVPTLYVFDSYS